MNRNTQVYATSVLHRKQLLYISYVYHDNLIKTKQKLITRIIFVYIIINDKYIHNFTH